MRWIFFWRSEQVCTLCTCAVGFQFFRLPFWEEIKIWRFCLILRKHLLIIKIITKAASEFYCNFPSLSIVDFYQSSPLIRCTKNLRRFTCHRRLSELILGPHAASGIILRVTGCLLYSASSSLKRVTSTIFRISKCFHWSKSKLQLWFRNNNAAKILKTQQHRQKKLI
jgi:hypothetical protein